MSDVDNQNRIVGLGCACDHIRYEIPVARRVQKHYVSVVHNHLLDSDIDSDSSQSLLLGLVGNPCKLEGLLAHFLGLFLVLMDDLVGYLLDHVHELAHEGRFARIHVPDYNDVQRFGGLDMLLDLQVRVVDVVVVSRVLLHHLGAFPRAEYWRLFRGDLSHWSGMLGSLGFLFGYGGWGWLLGFLLL